MTSKERVLSTLSCGAADRVAVDYDANPGIDIRLASRSQAFLCGLCLLCALGVLDVFIRWVAD